MQGSLLRPWGVSRVSAFRFMGRPLFCLPLEFFSLRRLPVSLQDPRARAGETSRAGMASPLCARVWAGSPEAGIQGWVRGPRDGPLGCVSRSHGRSTGRLPAVSGALAVPDLRDLAGFGGSSPSEHTPCAFLSLPSAGLCPSPCRTPALWPPPPLLFGHQPTGSGDSRAVAPQELRGLGARLAPRMGPQRVRARQALPSRELPSTLGASPRTQPGALGAHGRSPVLSPHPRLLPLGPLIVPDPPPGVPGSSLSWGVLHAFHTRLKCGYCPTTRAEPAGSSQGRRTPRQPHHERLLPCSPEPGPLEVEPSSAQVRALGRSWNRAHGGGVPWDGP